MRVQDPNLDMIFVAASGNTPDAHFAFQHMTTQYLTYSPVINNHEGWQVFAGLNGFHHVFMHLFFAGITWTHPLLPLTRYIQLIVGIACDLWLVRQKFALGESCRGYVVSAILLNLLLDIVEEEDLVQGTLREGWPRLNELFMVLNSAE